jgi:F-type H+-transporting ATPase subunit gamma
MAGLKQIKTNIRSIEKTQKVTKAMEAVSAAKMRKAQHTALNARAYARSAASILAHVSHARMLTNHPLARRGQTDKALYIVITSDKGLAGALNSAVLRKAYDDIRRNNWSNQGNLEIVAVGRKARDFFTAREFPIVAFYPNTAETTVDSIHEILHEAARLFTLKEVDIVKIAYQNFVSTFEQRPILRTIFPLSLEELRALVNDIVPKQGKFSELTDSDALLAQGQSFSIEPSSTEVLDAILPRLASIFVYHALLESQASEHSARMVAMKSASDKASERRHALIRQFNKARQAAITREVSEITGGMEAMAG